MLLDILEADFLGELSADTHGVWEIFEFVRLHYPGRDNSAVFKIGEEYLSRWIEMGWIAVAEKPLYPTEVKSMAEVLAFVRKNDVASVTYIEEAPSLDITQAGKHALLQASNQTPAPTRFARGSS